MSTPAARLAAVQARLQSACQEAGRAADSVRLLCVSKTQGAAAVRELVALGEREFAENYVQEALSKMADLADLRSTLIWHFIGPLQSNKTRAVAEHFDWVHSVDSLKLAQRLSSQRPAHLPALQVCLQVNLEGEASKSGVAPAALLALAHAVAALPGLLLRGLMSIPSPSSDPAVQRQQHQTLAACQAELLRAGLALDTLSMGMSADLEAAVAAGSTCVRIGTALFGARAPYSSKESP